MISVVDVEYLGTASCPEIYLRLMAAAAAEEESEGLEALKDVRRSSLREA